MALFKGSDYENTPLFDADDEGRTAFRGLRARRLREPEPTLEHTVSTNERLDSVAWNYYADPRAWRLLAEANPDALFPEDLLFTPTPMADNGANRLGHVILIGRKKGVR